MMVYCFGVDLVFVCVVMLLFDCIRNVNKFFFIRLWEWIEFFKNKYIKKYSSIRRFGFDCLGYWFWWI